MDINEKSSISHEGIYEARRACYQFARLYFAFCKTLYEKLGKDQALALSKSAIFSLSIDRTSRMREKAVKLGLPCNVETFGKLNDLPASIWTEYNSTMGSVRCPYAEVWLEYIKAHDWFLPFATQYCDVIDTTNIENYTRDTSHRLTKSVLWGDSDCEREYFPCEKVKQGTLTFSN